MTNPSSLSITENALKRHGAILGKALIIVIASRLLLYTIGYLGLNLFPSYTSPPVYNTQTLPGEQIYQSMDLPEYIGETEPLRITNLYKFDVYSYHKIAKHGYDQYSLEEPHPPANWVFFPLYPLLAKAFSYLVPWWSLHTAGVLLSNLLLTGALYFIQLIALERGLTKHEAGQILFMLVMYPASLFFSLMYTESLFLFLSAAVIYFSMTKRYFLAFLAAGLSTVTRVPGVANLMLAGGTLAFDLISQRKWRFRRSDAKYIGYGIISLLPLAAYFIYMKDLTGSFLAPIQEQNNWGREETFPFQNYLHYFRAPYFILRGGGWDNGFLSFVMATLVLLVFGIYGVKHFRTLMGNYRELLFFAYGLVLITIPFSSSPTVLTSIIRYMMVSIPLYFYLHSLTKRHELLRQFTIALMTMFNVIITVGFIRNYFFVV